MKRFDDFDIEASSIITMVTFYGGGPYAQDRIAEELRKFVATQVPFVHREPAPRQANQ